MKILFLSDDFPPESKGGAEIVAFNLVRALQKRGHFVFVITTTRDKTSVNYSHGPICISRCQEPSEGYSHAIFKIFSNYNERWRAYLSLYNPKTVSKVKEILKEFKPDIVHAHNLHRDLSYHCLKIAKKYGKAVFLTAHDVMLVQYGKWVPKHPEDFKITILDQIREAKKRYNPLRDIIIRHYLKYPDKIFAVSNSLKTLLEVNGIKNIETIYNGIDIDEWKEEESEVKKFKEKYNLFGKKIIFFGGRLSKLKGGEKIIQALVKIKEEIPQVILLVVGKKGSETKKMELLSRELGVGDNIIFTNWLEKDNLKSAYWSSDLVVLPSIYFDPFPTLNLEAMACKKPVVGTCFGGTPEIVQNEVTGYIVNPHDIEVMAEKIIDLLKNPKKAKQFGEAGFERVKTNFSLEQQVKKTLFWYQKIMGENK
ncbi:MAG: glycosyltransferase family 4 protein [Patescibacteria group bacterium]|nr:glycosyltransferase family 4 protein [Patescibacteria group bacterium]